ncbi:hypothetical protein CBOM_08073 [Ceraceosorus bombacis]|uniref:Uncharacterized protein n=1 Tax=Ceraceosorus bombacis TaxID=401625 RepID=A0A0P1BAP7_9BASI|nr:hypothetical protein CBOM_08073 [Ceraceosorus bombacis]
MTRNGWRSGECALTQANKSTSRTRSALEEEPMSPNEVIEGPRELAAHVKSKQLYSAIWPWIG